MAPGNTGNTTDKIIQFAGLALQAVIIGLLIWLLYKAYECGTDNSKCPKTIYGIFRIGTKYDKYAGMSPSSNVETIDDDKVTSANTCATWCTKTYGCEGFLWDGTKCSSILSDPKSLILVPGGGDTYINQDSNHPGAGFIARPAGENFSNVIQNIGSITTKSTLDCAKDCVAKVFTANCVGYTMVTSTNCQLVSNISNVLSTTGAQSYVWQSLTSSNYKEAKF